MSIFVKQAEQLFSDNFVEDSEVVHIEKAIGLKYVHIEINESIMNIAEIAADENQSAEDVIIEIAALFEESGLSNSFEFTKFKLIGRLSKILEDRYENRCETIGGIKKIASGISKAMGRDMVDDLIFDDENWNAKLTDVMNAVTFEQLTKAGKASADEDQTEGKVPNCEATDEQGNSERMSTDELIDKIISGSKKAA